MGGDARDGAAAARRAAAAAAGGGAGGGGKTFQGGDFGGGAGSGGGAKGWLHLNQDVARWLLIRGRRRRGGWPALQVGDMTAGGL